MTKLKWVAKKIVYCQDCLSASPCLSQKSHRFASPLRHSVDEESWRLHPPGPVSHCYECKAASPFPDLWLSAVKAVTILHTAVQYKHFPFSPVPWRVYDVWNQGIRFLFRRLKKNHTRWVIGMVCGRSDHCTRETRRNTWEPTDGRELASGTGPTEKTRFSKEQWSAASGV